jgi:hypothetical protein
VVKAHARDREHLEMMLESMGLLGKETDSFRELAYRGNSAIWGAQARTRASIAFIAPSSSAADKIDAVHIAGLVGVHRLRPSGRCRLLVQRPVDQASPAFTIEEVCPGSGDGYLPQLLTEFCSANMPALSFETFPGGRRVLVPEGEVGNRATFDCYNGTVIRGLPAHRSSGSEYGMFQIANLMPAEMLVFDLIFHRTLGIGDVVEAILFGAPGMSPGRAAVLEHDDPRHADQLPISERPREIPGTPPALSTPLVPAMARIVDRVHKRMGWNPREFRALRLQLPYPPVGSSVVMRWPLPAKTG